MTKEWVAHVVGRALRGRVATVVSELGCPLDPLELTEHGSWRQEPHSGGLGWGLPCAMGIKLADPDRLVVATIGDGSYMFANPVACHQVAEAHGIAVLAIVLNNAGYGAVRSSVLGLYPTGYAAKFDDDAADRRWRRAPTSPRSPRRAAPTPKRWPTAAISRPRSTGRCTPSRSSAARPCSMSTSSTETQGGWRAGSLAGSLDGPRRASGA